MAQDNSNPYKPSDDEWNRASQTLNQYNDQAGGGNINWDAARNTFNQQAAGGGNYGDWVNKTFDARSGWTTPSTAAAAPKSYNPFDRTSFRDSWMSQGGNYGGDVGKFLTDQNLDPSQFSQVSGTNGAWRLPTGEVIDLVMDKGGSNKAAFTGAGQQNVVGGAIQQYNTGQPQMTPAQSNATQNYPTQPSTAQTPDQAAKTAQDEAMRKQLFDQLMGRAQQGLNVDRNDPTIRAQADAYSANEERSKRNYLSDIAERSGPYATGNLRNEQRMAEAGVGQRTGAFEAQLMGRELQSKRDEVAQALQSEQGMLSTNDQLALQKELAQMDDAIKRLSLQQNNSQFGQNLGLNYAQLAQQGNQFNQSLGQNNDQFLANFGLQSTHDANYWDSLRSGLING